MDQLFQALPTDIQWEILSVFAGTHSVRNGKLIKKIVFDERHQLLENIARIRTTWDPPLILEVIPVSFVPFSNGTQLMFTYHPGWGTEGYMFISNTIIDKWQGRKHEWKRLDIVTGTHWRGTPPYEKHVYPSYEYTDKKKKLLYYR